MTLTEIGSIQRSNLPPRLRPLEYLLLHPNTEFYSFGEIIADNTTNAIPIIDSRMALSLQDVLRGGGR